MIASFSDTLTRRCGVRHGDRVLVAVSGGADSTCLLHLLLEFREREGYPELHVAHLDHAVRGASGQRAAAALRRICRARQVPCTIGRLPAWTSPPSEDALRRARHRFLERVGDEVGARSIALAHHRRDQAETVLWNLARGSGRRGLGGMRMVNGRRIRPLLEAAPEEIRAWLRARRIGWHEDETNRSPAFTRNRVRALIPLLARRIHPAAEANLARAARILGAEDDLLDALAAGRLEDLARTRRRSRNAAGEAEDAGASSRAGPAIELDARLLSEEPRALALRILRVAVRELSGGRLSLSYARTERLAALAASKRGRSDLGGGLRAERAGSWLRIEAAPLDRSAWGAKI